MEAHLCPPRIQDGLGIRHAGWREDGGLVFVISTFPWFFIPAPTTKYKRVLWDKCNALSFTEGIRERKKLSEKKTCHSHWGITEGIILYIGQMKETVLARRVLAVYWNANHILSIFFRHNKSFLYYFTFQEGNIVCIYIKCTLKKKMQTHIIDLIPYWLISQILLFTLLNTGFKSWLITL